jgi:hypothetical protein
MLELGFDHWKEKFKPGMTGDKKKKLDQPSFFLNIKIASWNALFHSFVSHLDKLVKSAIDRYGEAQ